VLFEARFWPLIADGSVTLTFRRWKKPQAAAGRPNRTPAGIVDVISVRVVDPEKITKAEAKRSGYASAEALRADLRGDAASPVYRVEFRLAQGPDPRAELAAAADLDAAGIADLTKRLDRLDAASPIGPWTRRTLRLISEQPGVSAAVLATGEGRERLDFKTDVRKLKKLGLTESLQVGYRISPRGSAYLAASDPAR